MSESIAMLKGDFAVRAARLLSEAQAAGLPGWARSGVSSIIGGLSAAVSVVDTAGVQLATLSQNATYSNSLKAERMQTVLTEAERVSSENLRLSRMAAEQLHAGLRKAVLPSRPGDMSDVLLVDRKADVTALLAGEGNAEAIGQKVVDLAKRAAMEKDGLTLYILAGGPLGFFYERHGVDTDLLAERLAGIGDQQAAAELLAHFKGRDSIPAVITVTENAVELSLTDLHENYDVLITRLKAAKPIR